MGYTHYAYVPLAPIEDHVWEDLKEDIHAICDSGDWLSKHAWLDDDLIQVRGACEWFTLERNPKGRDYEQDKTFIFTKTRRMDYDEYIIACYLSLKNHVPEAVISSDGDFDELQAGLQRYCDVFDYKPASLKSFHDDMYGGDE